MKFKLLAVLLIFNCMDFDFVYAHAGRTDKNGGHTDRKTGTYHYHGGSPSGSTSSGVKPSSKTEISRIIELEQQVRELEQRLKELEQRLGDIEQQVGEPRQPSTNRLPRKRPSTIQSEPSNKITHADTVYATRTGSKYHRSGCRFLKKSRIPYSLEEVKSRYSPCKVCKPPE